MHQRNAVGGLHRFVGVSECSVYLLTSVLWQRIDKKKWHIWNVQTVHSAMFQAIKPNWLKHKAKKLSTSLCSSKMLTVIPATANIFNQPVYRNTNRSRG